MSLYKGTRRSINYKNTIIYKITCLVNNKVYIGQTTNSLEKRFKAHLLKSSGCKKLKHAIEKFGKDNFIIEQIDSANTKEEANKKEKAYIKKYNSISEGYNILSGGYSLNEVACTKIYCVEKDIIYSSLKECAEQLELPSVSMLSAVCTGRKPTYKGYHFCYVDEKNKPKIETVREIEPFEAKIKCVETGEIFANMRLAAEFVKKSKSGIQACLMGRAKTCGNYHWEYVDECRKNKEYKYVTKSPRGKNNRIKVPIVCIETSEKFNSVSDASKKYKVHRSSLYTALNNPHRTCSGYHWFYLDKRKAA